MVRLGEAPWIAIIAVFTGVETLALATWLRLVRGEPLLSAAVATGLGILVIGLIIEHILTDVAVNGVNFDLPFGAILAISLTEAVIWGVWLEVAVNVGGLAGLGLALVFLAVILIPQHSIEDNVLRGRDLLSDPLNPGTVGFSLVEAAGATIWLAFVLRPDLIGGGLSRVDAGLIGLAVLAVALFIEHNIGVQFSRR